MVTIEKNWVCKFCKAIVPREKRFEHLIKNHSPLEFFDYLDVVKDEWESPRSREK